MGTKTHRFEIVVGRVRASFATLIALIVDKAPQGSQLARMSTVGAELPHFSGCGVTGSEVERKTD